MGPPPDTSDMLQMLDNPMFQSQMNEAMNNPAVIQMLQNNPMSMSSVHWTSIHNSNHARSPQQPYDAPNAREP